MNRLIERAGPAFDEPVKYRIRVLDKSYACTLTDNYAWIEPLNAYSNLPGVEVQMNDGEFVDVVQCAFNSGETRYLIVRQMESIVSSMSPEQWELHTKKSPIFIFEQH